MSVMHGYGSLGEAMGTPWDELGTIPAPPGTSLGPIQDAVSLFSEIVSALALAPVPGTFTPWATRVGDMEWEEIPKTDTNVKAWTLTDGQIAAATEVTFGSPLPFVVVVTKRPMTTSEVAKMWEGTAYAPYETQAMYLQEDAKPDPTIYYFHWGERIDISKLPSQTLAIGPKVESVPGQLVFAAQIPAQDSTIRAKPISAFADAQRMQMAQAEPAPPPPAPAPSPIPIVRAPEEPMHLGIPIAVGLGGAVLGYILWSKRRR